MGWHHAFPDGVPPAFDVGAIQVPDGSFVILSVSLPPGVTCSIHDPSWSAVADLTALLTSTSAVYTTAQNTCFVRVPPTNAGNFEASGLSIPNQTYFGSPTPTTYFTVDTGCAATNATCKSVVPMVPTLPN